MNKKKLPKAIRPMTDEIGDTAAGPNAGELQQARAGSSEPAALDAGRASDVSGPPPSPQAASPPVTRALAPATPTSSEGAAERRRVHAFAVVERYAAYSAVGGFVPLPIVNVASITAVIVRMVKVLSDLYGIPFERDRARAIVIGLMGGAAPMGFSAVTASTLMYVIPGSNLIGLAVSTVSAYACTRSIGRLLVDRFEGGGTLHDFPAAERT
jgi:uncharacterized protein (DUF697 family)